MMHSIEEIREQDTQILRQLEEVRRTALAAGA
jgi:hypothetical protein